MSDSFGLIKGLKVTFKELFRKSVTDKYPKEFRKKPQRFHGRHVLNKYEDGMENVLVVNCVLVFALHNVYMFEVKITLKKIL